MAAWNQQNQYPPPAQTYAAGGQQQHGLPFPWLYYQHPLAHQQQGNDPNAMQTQVYMNPLQYAMPGQYVDYQQQQYYYAQNPESYAQPERTPTNYVAMQYGDFARTPVWQQQQYQQPEQPAVTYPQKTEVPPSVPVPRVEYKPPETHGYQANRGRGRWNAPKTEQQTRPPRSASGGYPDSLSAAGRDGARKKVLAETAMFLNSLRSQTNPPPQPEAAVMEEARARNGNRTFTNSRFARGNSYSGRGGRRDNNPEWKVAPGNLEWKPSVPGNADWKTGPPGNLEWKPSTPGNAEWKAAPGATEWKAAPGATEWKAPSGNTEWKAPSGNTEWKAPSGNTEWKAPSGGTEWKANVGAAEWKANVGAAEWKANVGAAEWKAAPGGNEWKATAGTAEWKSGGTGWKSAPGNSSWKSGGTEWKPAPANSEWKTGASGNRKKPGVPAAAPAATVDEDDASQRERLSEQLTRGVYECMVCFERVRQSDPVWSCGNCYHIFHLWCIKKWAKSSKSDEGWRCPACQNVSLEVPHKYVCFCRKISNPEWNHSDVPHTCGEVCAKGRPDGCPHKCLLLCHPGPCPPCTVRVSRACGCGKIRKATLCGQREGFVCGQTCQKKLNCGAHECEGTCHDGLCDDCKKLVSQECHCGKNKRSVSCAVDTQGVEAYSCGSSCGKQLSCGTHQCELSCHDGECQPCPLSPDQVTHCPCGQTLLSQLGQPRTSCSDPVPCCQMICGKILKCGPTGGTHKCQSTCHAGPCPTCPDTTAVRCRCKYAEVNVPCKDLKIPPDPVKCDRRCNRKKSCGRHKCGQTCCIDEHICAIVCGRNLSCGLHKCDTLCHLGNCPPCQRTSFEELSCECGSTITYPPVPCGTPPPECPHPCPRTHPCPHPPHHTCHSETQCPPCTVLTERLCHGRHEMRKNVPCHFSGISCGMPCGKELACGRHRCRRTCHQGDCVQPGESCVQPCTALRKDCPHICAAQCHPGDCPDTACRELVTITCVCGHRSASVTCNEKESEYNRVVTSLLALRLTETRAGHSVEVEVDLLGTSGDRKDKSKILECNDECALIERNRRIALALQIQNPELTNKLGPPKYTQFMKDWAKKDSGFAQMVHDKLAELVQLAKESKQKSRSFSFDPMNRDKRQFVHEYCEHFGCESRAYDQEPKRNVVATAVRDKSWLPSQSLMQVVQREMGQRKPPAPVIGAKAKSIKVSSTSVNLNNLSHAAVAWSGVVSEANKNQAKEPSEKASEPVIDYFDCNG